MSLQFLAPKPSAGPRRIRSERPTALVLLSLCCLAALAMAALLGRRLAPTDPARQNLSESGLPPGSAHLLGTDSFGRDILSRVLVGARPALEGPCIVALCATAAAVVLGLLAGFRGGWIEAVIMRAADMVLALPALLVVIVTVGLFTGGYWLAVVMLIVLTAPSGTRVIRSAVLAQRTLPYIEAARTVGVTNRRLMFVHILPNISATVVASLLLDFVGSLIALSSLSFLGLGSPPGTPDWGKMLVENRGLLEQNPSAAVAPAVLLIVAAFSMTVLGDWAYSRLEEGKNVRD
ncbi:ABC transporter permease [Streptomyces oryzae]|uniref:ABC transporter permease n=1 Tax=Streptomyces oryzae TaxID=1434886 RepID=A0ABS3XAP8_9ACTN|nr:ABC transporter permease [Streptomyces oryzae]MBO8192454.1 ABC transporter permease [Streptomyces oryzae]